MKGRIPAGRYAKALLGLLPDEKAQMLLAVFERLAEAFGDKHLRFALYSPALSHDDKVDLLWGVGVGEASVDEHTTKVAKSFLHLLLGGRRLLLLPAIREAFEALLDERAARHRGEVSSAAPLDQQARDELTELLKATELGALELRYRTDPELLGGVRVVTRGKILDLSLRRKLDRLIATTLT